MNKFALLATGLATLLSAAHASSILSPGDFVIAIDPDISPSASNSNPAGSENVTKLFDGNLGSKYLNTGGPGTGFIATPTSPFALQSFTMTTGGDAPDRDPTRYELYGTNSPITSADQSSGTAESWTLVSTGPLSLPAGRGVTSSVIPVTNTTSYSSYKVVYPTDNGSNLIQVAEFSGFDNTAGTGTSKLAGATALAIDAPTSTSRHPAAEGPANAINGQIVTANKYLNFGKADFGMIVTPASGASTAESMTVWSGGDNVSFPGRNPTSYLIYGTNSAISSYDNGYGDSEPWTFISGGDLTIAPGNLTSGTVTWANNATSYTSYKIIFPTIVGGSDSGAISQVQLDTVPEPAAAALAGVLGLGLLARRRK